MSSFITDTSIQTTLTDAELEEYLLLNGRRDLVNSYDYISSNIITNVLMPYDTIALRNTALNSYTTTTALNTLLSGKEANLTFNAPLTRSTNTISLDLSSYTTTSALNTALINYIPKTSTSISLTGTNPFYTFGTTSDGLSKASTAGAYSGSASIGDLIIRSEGTKKLILQHSSGTGAIIIDSNNNTTINNTLTANTIVSSGLVNTYFTSNQLASQKFINSNSIDLNYIRKYAGNKIDVNGLTINTNRILSSTTTYGLKIHSGNAVDSGGAPVLFGLGTEAATWSKCAIGHIRTGTYDQGDIVFLNRNTADTNTCDISNEKMRITANGAKITGNLEITATLTANTISSTGLTASLATKENVLTFSSPLVRTVNTISLDTNLSGLSSNQLASQQFINSNSIDLNYIRKYVNNSIDVNTIAITGGSANYDGGSSVDPANKTNTYISFKDAGASTDWAYLRQIGATNAYKLALDFCDDGSDARFCIRNNKSTDNPDTITEVFTVDNGNVTATGTINGATLQQGGVGVSTLITNALSSYLPLTGGTVSGTLTLNTSTQLQSRIKLTGQEFYQAANTSTDGIALLLGVNRTDNRQLWIADTAKLTQNATNPTIRISSEGYIDCIATNGINLLPLTFSGSAIWLSGPAQCTSSLGVTGTLTANTISSTGLTTLFNAKQATLTAGTTLLGTGGSITGIDYNNLINKPTLTDLTTISGLYLNSNQLASQQFINSNSVSLNYLQKYVNNSIDVNTIAITGGNATYDLGNVDATNKTNTYISFKAAGTGSDWCYLRQIGGNEAYKLVLDFCDDGTDARFCIRNNKSVDNPDTITEVFTVDNGNVTATGTINGATLQQGGTGISTLITNALSSYLPLTGGNISGNMDFGGTIAITGANANFNTSGVDAGNLTNTYISFKGAGAGNDWCYLRQIGASENIKLALDFLDDNNDARFCIRSNQSTANPDTITEVFTVDNGNVTATGTLTIAGATTLSSTLSVAGTTTCSSTLTTAGEVKLTGTNVINFGYNVTKTDDATGRIGYGTYEANALCIVGGATSGSRKVTIWDYVEIKGSLTTTGAITMPNGSYLYGGNNVSKRQGLYLNGVYGGGYYYNTIDYSSYVSSEWGYEYCFRITSYPTNENISGSGALQCYLVWVRNNSGTRTSYATIIAQSNGCGIQIGTNNNNLALTYPNDGYGSSLKHIIFENIAWASS